MSKEKDEVFLNFSIPRALRDRTKYAAQRLGMSLTHIYREAIREKSEYLLHKIELDETKDEQRLNEMLSKKKRRGRPFNVNKLINETTRPKPDQEDAATSPLPATSLPTSADDPILMEYAKKIAAVFGQDVNEQRVLVAECVAAVKRRAPLTSPSDSEIVELLEKEVLKLLDEMDKAKAALVGVPKRRVDGLAWDGDT